MQRKIKKDELEFKLFQKWWTFRQNFYEPRSDEEFELLVKEIDDFVGEFEGTALEWMARSMALLHAEDCDRRFRENLERERWKC